MSLCNTKNKTIVEKLAITDLVDWNIEINYFYQKFPTLVLLCAMLSVAVAFLTPELFNSKFYCCRWQLKQLWAYKTIFCIFLFIVLCSFVRIQKMLYLHC